MLPASLSWREAYTGDEHYLVGIGVNSEGSSAEDLLSIVVTDMTRYWKLNLSASDIRRVTAAAGIEVAHGEKAMFEFLEVLRSREEDSNTAFEVEHKERDILLTIVKKDPQLRLNFGLRLVESAEEILAWKDLVAQLFGTIYVMDRQLAALRREMKRKDIVIKLLLEKIYTLQRDPWLVSSTVSTEDVDEEKHLRENKWIQELVGDNKQLARSLYRFDWDNMQRDVQARVPHASLWDVMAKILRDRSSWTMGSQLGFDTRPQGAIEEPESEIEDAVEPETTTPIRVSKRKFGKVSTESPPRKLKQKSKRKFGKNSA